jgi:Fe-S-cluster containining protein
MAISLACERCTACCRWPGEVRLSDEEVAQLAAFKELTEQEFIERFTRLRADRQGLALKEQAGGACIFLEGRDCAVQAVKPQQCQDFPNRWMNSLWGKVPLETIQKEYPMLMNCAAVKTFIRSEAA